MFKKEYYYTFRNTENIPYTVELWRNTDASISATEVKACFPPFETTTENKGRFSPIWYSSCDLTLLSQTNMQFLNLFTSKIQDVQIRAYENTTPIFYGYLNSELYNEPFNQLDNYDVSFTGNDGFKLLERLKYVDASGNNYTDISSKWEVLGRIVTKLNLPYEYIYVKNSTTSPDFTIGSNETIFHKLNVINDNYYNEDGEPENCLTVLEAILNPWYSFIKQEKGNLIISDYNSIAQGGYQSFKRFSASTFQYVDTVLLNMDLGDISSLKHWNGNLNIETAYNKQTVCFSPYKKNPIFEENLKDLETLTPDSSIEHGINEPGYKWKEFLYRNNAQYTWQSPDTSLGYLVKMVGTGTENADEKDYYIKLGRTNSTYLEQAFYLGKLNYLLGTGKQFLKISFKGKVRTFEYLKYPDEQTPLQIASFKIDFLVKCGWSTAQQGYVSDGEWYYSQGAERTTFPYPSLKKMLTTDQKVIYLLYKQPDYSTPSDISNQWVECSRIISLPQIQHAAGPTTITRPVLGNLEIGIYQNHPHLWVTDMNNAFIPATDNRVKDVLIKDLKIEITDDTGVPVNNNDYEYVGYMDPNFQNQAPQIDLINGTNDINSCALGTMLINDSSDYKFAKNFTREGQTDSAENLLLRSYISNLQNPAVTLSITMPTINSLGVLECNNYLPNKKFIPVRIKQKFEEAESEIEMTEITKDNLTIT